VLLVSPSQNPSPNPPSSRDPSPVELHENGSAGLDSNDDEASPTREDGLEEDSTLQVNSDREEEDMDDFADVGGAEPKEVKDIRGWQDLREQIKSDLLVAHKRHDPISRINQLMVLRNFATLRLKGVGRIAASEAIARQWQDGEGVHFACQIRYLACQYQLFEQIPANKQGGDRGRSLLNDERVQAAARTYLRTLLTGEVTPTKFGHALNERILPSLGYSLKAPLSGRTMRRWLVKLGWRHKELRKGVYMDGHERQDVKDYRQDIFLPLMALHAQKMVHWEPSESESGLMRIDPDLGLGEKRVIAVFQDESSFHANEYKRNIWCAP
jgi:hypothetical protein